MEATNDMDMSGEPIAVMPVGHPGRPVAARALMATAVGAALFTAFAAVTTQVAAVRAVSPWQDDPYDVVVTFTMFFVPALSAVAALRVLLCRRVEPLPAYRVDQLLRSALLVSALIEITVLADWISLVVRANRHLWSHRTPVLVAALGVVSVVAVAVHRVVCRARVVASSHRVDDGDWLGDVAAFVALVAARTGDPLRFAGFRRFVAVVVRFVRAHFVVLAAVGSIAVGTLVVARLSVAEGSSGGALFAVEAFVFAGGTFAFVMVADVWLRLAIPPQGARHTVGRVGATVAAATLPVSLAVRGPIWSVTGHANGVRTPEQLAVVTLTSAVVCGVVAGMIAYAVTSARRRMSRARGD